MLGVHILNTGSIPLGWKLSVIIPTLFLCFGNRGFAQGVTSTTPWNVLEAGIEQTTLPLGNDSSAKIVRIDPKLFTLRVIDVFGTVDNAHIPFSKYSLSEVVDLIKPLALINAGSSASYSLPIATGLLRVAGRDVSHLNPDSDLQTGVFCISNNNALKILDRAAYKAVDCRYAVQSGPILIRNGQNSLESPEQLLTEKSKRSLVAIDRKGRLLFISTRPATLTDIINFLKDYNQSELMIQHALNLNGGIESALYSQHSHSNETDKLKVPVVSAIAVLPHGR